MEEESRGVCGRIILKWVSEKYRVQLTCGLNQTYESFMVSFCEDGDVDLRYVEGENRTNSLVQ